MTLLDSFNEMYGELNGRLKFLDHWNISCMISVGSCSRAERRRHPISGEDGFASLDSDRQTIPVEHSILRTIASK